MGMIFGGAFRQAMLWLGHSLCVSRPPGKSTVSLQRQHRPWCVLGGVLQELRGEVQEIRPAVGEARRQAVRSAGLAATWVMVVVVVVSVRHHPSHQGGHRVFNFADHLRHRRSKSYGRKIKRDAMWEKKTTTIHSQWRGSFQEAIFFLPWPHVTAFRQADTVFSSLKQNKTLTGCVWAVIRQMAISHLRRQGFTWTCSKPWTHTHPNNKQLFQQLREILIGCFSHEDWQTLMGKSAK